MGIIVKQTGRPGAVLNLIDPVTKKIVYTTTADAKGVLTITNPPPGRWQEQLQFSHPVVNGPAQTVSETPGDVIDYQTNQAAHGPVVTDANGSVWQLTVTTGGVLGATKIAN